MIPLCCLLKSIQNSSDSAEQTFKSLFEKEKPGRVHCYGKTMTPSQFRKNEEIAAIKKEHANEISGMAKEIQDLPLVEKWESMTTYYDKYKPPIIIS